MFLPFRGYQTSRNWRSVFWGFKITYVAYIEARSSRSQQLTKPHNIFIDWAKKLNNNVVLDVNLPVKRQRPLTPTMSSVCNFKYHLIIKLIKLSGESCWSWVILIMCCHLQTKTCAIPQEEKIDFLCSQTTCLSWLTHRYVTTNFCLALSFPLWLVRDAGFLGLITIARVNKPLHKAFKLLLLQPVTHTS